MTDGHHIILKFDMLGDVASIEERLKILVGFAHDLNARQVGATIDPDDMDFNQRITRAICDIRILLSEWRPATLAETKKDIETLDILAGQLYGLMSDANKRLIKKCADPNAGAHVVCRSCPNALPMYDGGMACAITGRSITGAFL